MQKIIPSIISVDVFYFDYSSSRQGYLQYITVIKHETSRKIIITVYCFAIFHDGLFTRNLPVVTKHIQIKPPNLKGFQLLSLLGYNMDYFRVKQ